jgi:integrase
MLRESHDVGKAVSPEDEIKLLEAIRQSRSPALLPLFVLSIDSGLRASEVRALQHCDLKLTWNAGAIEQGWLTVSKLKTEAGTRRTVPLTSRVCSVLTLWLSRFVDSGLDAYVFPAHKIGFTGNSRRSDLYDIDLARPIGSWKKAWREALKSAGLHYRWHDCRHTFISRLAENAAVSEQTIMALAGHVSKSMMARYSHIRSSAKQAAIATLERLQEHHFDPRSPQRSPQSASDDARADLHVAEKLLN